MNYILETERLMLREIYPKDAPFVLELMNSDGWLTYIGDRKIVTLEAAEAYIVNIYMPFYTTYGFGPYVLELKTTK
ncbi:MAG: ribosomal-protein-alanine N-acetyltransferase [Patiriisocius sp.]|jgi:RimJ/RimL family protein N-acetyltransferase